MADQKQLDVLVGAALLVVAPVLVLVLVLLVRSPAGAHEAPAMGGGPGAGWSYSLFCCSDEDCAPLAEEAVRELDRGWLVVIGPGEHPQVPHGLAPLRLFVPHGDDRVRRSGDGRFHACLSRGGAALRCLYVRPAPSNSDKASRPGMFGAKRTRLSVQTSVA